MIAFAFPASADTVTMTNGEVLEGVIEQEGEHSVVLNIGMGAITLKQSKIASISRDAEAANLQRKEEWKTTYIKIGDLPPVLQKLSSQFDTVSGRRRKALTGSKSLPGVARRQEAQEKRWAAERKQHSAMTQTLAALSPADDVRAYNELVAENNKIVASVNRLQAGIERDKELRKTHRESIVAYSQALSDLESRFRTMLATMPEATGGTNKAAVAWIEQAQAQLNQFQNDFQRMTVPIGRQAGKGTIVGVSINGAAPASFILDTGASLVTLSETLARRLKLSFDRKSPMRLSMADGSETEGYPVILKSVSVGEARAELIEAVVISNAPADDVEGLLGMTFLRHFEMSFDASTANLVLTRLK